MIKEELRFFFLPLKAQKEKDSQKEKCRKEISLTAVSDRGYAPLDLRPLPWGAYIAVCEHGAKRS